MALFRFKITSEQTSMRETLPVALRLMFGHEGGYSNRPTDSGGPTKYGITAKTLAAHLGKPSVSAERVQALTLAEAEKIYRQSYWSQSGGDVLPKGLDYAVFDMGVNSGPNRGVKTLQGVLKKAGTYHGKIDGWIGEGTLSGVRDYEGGVPQLIRDFCTARMQFLMSIKGPKGWSANGRGWTIRVTGKDPKGQWKDQPGVLGSALKMAEGSFEPVADAPSDYDGAPEGGDAKAEPKPASPWADPGTVLTAGGGVASAAVPLVSGSAVLQWALAAVVVIAVCVGAFILVRKLGKAQA